MYGIYANIGGILMVNVTIYGIHGSYGIVVYGIRSPFMFCPARSLLTGEFYFDIVGHSGSFFKARFLPPSKWVNLVVSLPSNPARI